MGTEITCCPPSWSKENWLWHMCRSAWTSWYEPRTWTQSYQHFIIFTRYSNCLIQIYVTQWSLQICQIETGRLKLYKTYFAICGPNIFSVAKWPAVSSSPIILMTHAYWSCRPISQYVVQLSDQLSGTIRKISQAETGQVFVSDFNTNLAR